jgi:hypothetical protein
VTISADSIEATSVILVGELVGVTTGITEIGFCLSENPNPTISDIRVVSSGVSTGMYSESVDNLTPSTVYYYKSYAISSTDTLYGQEKTFDTIQELPLFTVDAILERALYNEEFKVAYFFTYSFEPVYYFDLEVVAVDTENGSVISRRTFEDNDPWILDRHHAIANYGGKPELYLAVDDKVHILDGETLEDITSIELGEDRNISSISVKNDVLFLGTWGPYMKLSSYSRQTLELISTAAYDLNARISLPYIDFEAEKIICLGFNQFSSSNLSHIDTFNLDGTYVGTQFYYPPHRGDKNMMKIKDESNYYIAVEIDKGYLYDKSDLETVTLNLQESNIIFDFQLSEDGSTIYTLVGGNVVNVYNAEDLSLERTLSVAEGSRHIFVDEDEVIVFNYEQPASYTIEIYMSRYPL